MKEHTQGPWTFKPKYADNSGAFIGADGKTVAAIVGSVRRPAEEKAANARLIAASPDLLEAADDALADLEGYEFAAETIRKLRAAIAKATGGAA